MSPLLLILIVVLVICLTYTSSSTTTLTNSFNVVFAGSSINDACNGVGTPVTAYSSSSDISADVLLYTNNQGSTPLSDGQYGYNGTRFAISGGQGQVVGVYGCA
jgi:hypothetical protein